MLDHAMNSFSVSPFGKVMSPDAPGLIAYRAFTGSMTYPELTYSSPSATYGVAIVMLYIPLSDHSRLPSMS